MCDHQTCCTTIVFSLNNDDSGDGVTDFIGAIFCIRFGIFTGFVEPFTFDTFRNGIFDGAERIRRPCNDGVTCNESIDSERLLDTLNMIHVLFWVN